MASLIYTTATGEAVSIGSVVANPLPAGLTEFPLTAGEFAGLTDGTLIWDVGTLAVIANPQVPIDILHAANTTDLEDKAVAAVASNIVTIGQIPIALADMQAIIDGSASNTPQINAALDQIATTMQQVLNRYEGTLRQLVAIERLLIAGDLLDDTAGS